MDKQDLVVDSLGLGPKRADMYDIDYLPSESHLTENKFYK